MIVPDWRSHIEPWLIARADPPRNDCTATSLGSSGRVGTD